MQLATLTSIAAILSSALAANLTLEIQPSQLLPAPVTLPYTTHATLSAPALHFTAPLSRRNTLDFADLPPATYLLTISSRDYYFPAYRVDITSTSENVEEVKVHTTFRGNEFSNLGPVIPLTTQSGASNTYTMTTEPIGRKEYFTPRPGFSPVSFLKNPMILMAVFSLGLTVGLPYLMNNMDEETKAEFEEMQKSGSGGAMAKALQGGGGMDFDLAGWMAGRGQGAAGAGGSEKRS